MRRILTYLFSMSFILIVDFQIMTAQGNSQTQSRPRARDLGVPFDGMSGTFNGITDVKVVEVGHTTLISGDDNGSGDIFAAFSTANPNAAQSSGVAQLAQLTMLPNDRMNPLFDATVQAVEEAIINSLVAAETMAGRDDHKVVALPHDGLREVLKKYNRLIELKE